MAEAKDNRRDSVLSQFFHKRPACKQLLEWIIVGVAILLLFAAFLLFVLIYHQPEHFGPQIHPPSTNSSMTTIRSTCSPELYTGVVCRDALLTYQECLTNGNSSDEIHIPSNIDQDEIEGLLRTLTIALPLLNPTPECTNEISPFLCFFYFGLCDSDGNTLQPSSEQCETIKDDICASEFELAMGFVDSDQIPQCELLPKTTIECTTVPLSESEFIDGQNSSSNVSRETIICREGFYATEVSGISGCKPQCGWELYSHRLELTIKILIITMTVLGIVAGIVVLTVSCFQHKRMLKFPSTFIVYQTATAMVFNLMMLIAASFQVDIFCASVDLLYSIANPTPYCTLIGLLFPYLYWQLLVWWLSHITVLYWGIRFPFHAKSFEASGKNKYIHLTVVLLGLFLPAVPAIAVGSGGGAQITRSPPLICASGSDNINFYAIILPAAVMQLIGCCILILIFWTVSQERTSNIPKSRRVTVEIKVLINIFYFIGASLLLVITFSLSYQRIPAGTLTQLLTAYFACENNGAIDNSCDSSRAELNRTIPITLPFDIALLLLAIFPVVNLTFVINVQQLKKWKWTNCRIKKHKNVSTINTTDTELLSPRMKNRNVSLV